MENSHHSSNTTLIEWENVDFKRQILMIRLHIRILGICFEYMYFYFRGIFIFIIDMLNIFKCDVLSLLHESLIQY